MPSSDIACHDHLHIHLKNSMNPLFGRPHGTSSILFFIGHHNARYTAIEIVLMLKEVEVALDLGVRAIRPFCSLLLTGVTDKLSAFLEIDMKWSVLLPSDSFSSKNSTYPILPKKVKNLSLVQIYNISLFYTTDLYSFTYPRCNQPYIIRSLQNISI